MKFGIEKLFFAFGLVFLLCSFSFAEKCTQPGSIRRVKNRSVGNVEYVIFDVYKSADSKLDYDVETASAPFTDYSGEETIPVRGSKYRKIVFKSIYWMCETQNSISTPRSAIKDIKELSRFEGISEYVVGLRSRSRYVTTYHYSAGSVLKVVMKFRK